MHGSGERVTKRRFVFLFIAGLVIRGKHPGHTLERDALRLRKPKVDNYKVETEAEGTEDKHHAPVDVVQSDRSEQPHKDVPEEIAPSGE